jgi:predicted enzyme related to lactoylglutathione lyase
VFGDSIEHMFITAPLQLHLSSALSIAFDAADPAALAHFWAAVTGLVPTVSEPDYIRLEGDEPGHPALVFREVEGWKKEPNRVGIELRCTGDAEAALARLLHLGARPVEQVESPWERRLTLRDPEGNEFTLVEPLAERVRLRRAA